MRALEALAALGALVGAGLGLRHMLAQRRRLRVAAPQGTALITSLPLPPDLRAAGFDTTIIQDDFAGARGTFDGVIVHALGAEERGGMSALTVYTLAVVLPNDVMRAAVSARPQRMRRARNALRLDRPDIDTRLDVTGDRAAALQIFAGADGLALAAAITTHHWRLVDGELVTGPLGPAVELGAVARAGAAAAQALLRAPLPSVAGADVVGR